MTTTENQAIAPRFIVSLITNVLRAAIGFTSAMLLARWLGPNEYGRMAFLLATFIAIKGLMDMGSSSAFFTFLSKRQRSARFISIYWGWVGIQFLFSILVVGLVLPDGVVSGIWKGESRLWVVLALVAAFMQHTVWPIASQMAEAQRETVRVQKLSVLFACIHFAAVAILWAVGQLAIPLLFGVIALEWCLAGCLASRLYQGHGETTGSGTKSSDSVGNVWREFWVYCLPFIPYVWVGFASQFTDRWILQHFGGAIHQAYYAVAAQLASISLIATTSVVKILWKEVAEANERGDDELVQRLYQRANRILFMSGVLISCFCIPWTREIITLVLGEEYTAGALVLAIMFLYPIHQALGQVNGTMFYALELTRPYVVIGIAHSIISIVTVYFLLAPADAILPGLGLSSMGLALKMVIVQFIMVNFSMWWLARKKGWEYSMSYQLAGIVIFLFAGFAVYYATNLFISGSLHVVIRGCMAGTVYIAFASAVLYLMPWLIGMTRGELIQHACRGLAAVR